MLGSFLPKTFLFDHLSSGEGHLSTATQGQKKVNNTRLNFIFLSMYHAMDAC